MKKTRINPMSLKKKQELKELVLIVNELLKSVRDFVWTVNGEPTGED